MKDAKTYARAIASAVSAVFFLLKTFGVHVPVIDENSLTLALTSIIALAALAWGFWKNNDFTDKAKMKSSFADILYDEMYEDNEKAQG